NALGVLPTRHYGGPAQPGATAWSTTRIWKMLHNPAYCGRHIYHSRHGAIPREVPALVSVEIWDRVQQQFARNKSLPRANAQRTYLLSGLLICGLCRLHFIGSIARKGRWEQVYYRCGALRRERKGVPRNPCLAKKVPAARLEAEVWAACRALI